MSAIAGTALLAVVYVPVRAIDLVDARFDPVFAAWNQFTPTAPYLGTCLLSLLLAWPLAKLLNCHTDHSRVRRDEIRENGDELEQMIMDAVSKTYERPQLYIFTLSNGKVYVGTIVSENDPYGRRRYVTILKVASGYRDGEHDVVLVTSYAKMLKALGKSSEEGSESESLADQIPPHITVSDFQVVIPKDEVFALSRFEPGLKAVFPDGPSLSKSG